jgi:hypothetical protein
MSWNYRVMKHTDGMGEWYFLHEVYYDKGKVVNCTENPIAPFGETPKELQQNLELMKKAFDKPTLSYEDM